MDTDKKIKRKIALILGLTTALQYQSSWAIPDPALGNPISTLGLDLPSQGLMLSDHDHPNTIWLGPKGRIKNTGTYQSLGASINCLELQSMRRATYRFPADSEIDKVIASNKSFSPAFDYLVGIDAHNTSLLYQIMAKKNEVLKLQEDNKDIYGEYEASSSLLQDLTTEKSQLDAAGQAAYQEYSQGLTVLNPALSESERKTQTTQLYSIYREKMTGISKRLNELNPQIQKAQAAYRQALKKWAPARDRLAQITSAEASIKATVDSLKSFAQTNFKQNQDVIAELEEKIVGKASAGFNLFDDEVNSAGKAIAAKRTELQNEISRKQEKLTKLQAGNAETDAAQVQREIASLNEQIEKLDVHFSQLNVFDVQFNSGVTVTTDHVVSGLSPSLNYDAVTYRVPAHTRITQATEDYYPSSFTAEANSNEPVNLLLAGYDANSAASASFDSFVTLGARCGYPRVEEKEVSYVDDKGKQVKTRALTQIYEDPSPNQAVFVQNVSVNYKYFAKAPLMQGRCEIDISKMESYWRSSGSSSSWSLFGGSSSSSWDDTKRTINQDMGLTCHMDLNPTGSDSADARERADAFERGIYNDMFNMFLMSYAKSYTIESVKPNVPTDEKHPLATAGNGIMNLCGNTNDYCKIANIVLMTMDEMIGARHSGSTSTENHETGRIYRNFSKSDFYVATGSSQIELKVCVDASKCN